MPNLNDVSSRVLPPVNQPVNPARVAAPKPGISPEPVSTPNPAAFEPRLRRQPAFRNLLEVATLEPSLDSAKASTLSARASQVPKPFGLIASRNELTGAQGFEAMSDKELVATLMRRECADGSSRFKGITRNAQDLTGVLQDFQLLAARDLQVPESEYDRTIADDAVLVMKDFASMGPNQVHALKEQAYAHVDVAPELEGAIDKQHYGSPRHRAFGALVEQLSGGVLSAEEAMAMCPCGGIPGDGASEIPLVGRIDSVARHAMRHDATGFLLTRFGVGPGYGSPTSMVGLNNANPMAGQILGIAREILGQASELPNSDHVALPQRFNQA